MAVHGKPPARRVSSDDFVVTAEDGTQYAPHAGQYVEFLPTVPIGMLRAANRILRLQSDLDALRDNAGNVPEDKEAAVAAMMLEHYDDLVRFAAHVVVAWDWTDDRGRPYSPPDGTDGPLLLLSAEEMYYLWSAAQGRNPAALGNASRPSATTSSATAPRKHQR